MSGVASKFRAGEREAVKREGSLEAAPAQGFSLTLGTPWGCLRSSWDFPRISKGMERKCSDWELSVGEERKRGFFISLSVRARMKCSCLCLDSDVP